MPECTNCGGFVTVDFARVFGDNQDQVYGCPECITATAIYNGAATTGPEADDYQDTPLIDG